MMKNIRESNLIQFFIKETNNIHKFFQINAYLNYESGFDLIVIFHHSQRGFELSRLNSLLYYHEPFHDKKK